MNEYEELGYIEAAIINLSEQITELRGRKKYLINKIKELQQNANQNIYSETGREISNGEQPTSK